MGFGELTSFMLYTFTVAFSIGALSGLYEDFAKAIGSTERVFEIIERSSNLADGKTELQNIQGSLHLENVNFSIRPDQIVPYYKISNLHIDQGQVVALVGP